MIAKYGLVIWSTPEEIKVIRSSADDLIKQRITKIKVPERVELPEHLYQSSKAKPSIQLATDSHGGQQSVNMYIVWLNVLKKVRLEYDSTKGKYGETKFIYEHHMGLVYFTGFNIHMSDACFVFCQFNYDKIDKG